MSAITVNPSFLSSSLPSPSSSFASSPAPSVEGPPRKRSRSELSSEERKQARAHRNRIAAQNSRDRRKAHHSFLEQRVAELEEENRRLRAGQGELPAPAYNRSAEEERERDRVRERENEELRERIKTLENGWNAVVKALAAQGLPTGITLPTPAVSTTTTESSPSSPQLSTTPVLVPNSTAVFPISPAPSSTSLFEVDAVKSEPTCHLAAGGLATNQHHLFIELPTSDSHQEPQIVSDAAMEDLFREILAPSPTSPATSLPLDNPTSSPTQFQIPSTSAPSAAPAQMMTTTESTVDWESEAEMQRLLDMLPDVQSSFLDGHDTQIALDFNFESEWDLERSTAIMGSGIGVF